MFASTHGDLAISDYMCATLGDTPTLISPIKFHNSVHNAAAGYWSIGTGSYAPYTAISAFEYTFGAGLLEAATQVAVRAAPVLYVAFDIEANGALATMAPSRGLLGAALVLAPERQRRHGALRLAHATTDARASRRRRARRQRRSSPTMRWRPACRSSRRWRRSSRDVRCAELRALSAWTQHALTRQSRLELTHMHRCNRSTTSSSWAAASPGLTLAIQLRREFAALDVLVLERRRIRCRAAAHKVGESTVEIGANYFDTVLGLKEHLTQQQLKKFGFRFFFSEGRSDIDAVARARREPLSRDAELSARSRHVRELPRRARARARRAVPRRRGRARLRARRRTARAHSVRYERDGAEHEVAARWLSTPRAAPG